MIYNWGFVKLEFFQEILISYLEGDPLYNNKIIEIQNPGFILLGNNPLSRVYFSRYTKVQDWSGYNSEFQDLQKYMKERKKNENIKINEEDWIRVLNEKAKMFMIPTSFDNQGLLLYPISKREDIQECFSRFITFEELEILPHSIYSILALPMYLSKHNNKWEYLNLSAQEKYVRMRTIDVEDWKDLVSNALETGNLDACEDDLSLYDVQVNDEGVFETMRRRLTQLYDQKE